MCLNVFFIVNGKMKIFHLGSIKYCDFLNRDNYNSAYYETKGKFPPRSLIEVEYVDNKSVYKYYFSQLTTNPFYTCTNLAFSQETILFISPDLISKSKIILRPKKSNFRSDR